MSQCHVPCHSLSGTSTSSGIIVDTQGLQQHEVLDSGRAIVGPGVNLEVFTAWAEELGITLPHGDCASVCFGGFLLVSPESRVQCAMCHVPCVEHTQLAARICTCLHGCLHLRLLGAIYARRNIPSSISFRHSVIQSL